MYTSHRDDNFALNHNKQYLSASLGDNFWSLNLPDEGTAAVTAHALMMLRGAGISDEGFCEVMSTMCRHMPFPPEEADWMELQAGEQILVLAE